MFHRLVTHALIGVLGFVLGTCVSYVVLRINFSSEETEFKREIKKLFLAVADSATTGDTQRIWDASAAAVAVLESPMPEATTKIAAEGAKLTEIQFDKDYRPKAYRRAREGQETIPDRSQRSGVRVE